MEYSHIFERFPSLEYTEVTKVVLTFLKRRWLIYPVMLRRPSACYYQDLGSASDWPCLASANPKHETDLVSDKSSVWKSCSRSSDVISRENQWWRSEMYAFFSGLRKEDYRENECLLFSRIILYVALNPLPVIESSDLNSIRMLLQPEMTLNLAKLPQ